MLGDAARDARSAWMKEWPQHATRKGAQHGNVGCLSTTLYQPKGLAGEVLAIICCAPRVSRGSPGSGNSATRMCQVPYMCAYGLPAASLRATPVRGQDRRYARRRGRRP